MMWNRTRLPGACRKRTWMEFPHIDYGGNGENTQLRWCAGPFTVVPQVVKGGGLRCTTWLPFPADGRRHCSNLT